MINNNSIIYNFRSGTKEQIPLYSWEEGCSFFSFQETDKTDKNTMSMGENKYNLLCTTFSIPELSKCCRISV